MFQNQTLTALSARPPQPLRNVVAGVPSTSSSIVISSADITDPSTRAQWEYNDPPPTELTVTLPSWPVGKSIGNTNTEIKVYLRRYFLDCVWRDSARPDEYITSNSGTSVSKKITLTFFVGVQGTTRLLRPNIERTATSDVDVIITRNQGMIGEYASNPYSTVESTNVDLFFENHFTNMNEYLGQPGLYIGTVDSQALAALKTNTVVTVHIATDRTDYPSPFWYRKFLTGVSLYNPLIHQFEIVDAGTEIKTYFKRLSKVVITQNGGPYMPTALATLASPLRTSLHRFISTATITQVDDPLWSECVVTQSKNVSCRVCQLGLVNSTDLSVIDKRAFASFAAPSDQTSFSIQMYDKDTSTVSQMVVANSTQGDVNPLDRFVPYSPFRFPNGVWAGSPLESQLVSDGTYSCFPFEQSLSENVLKVLNDTVSYSALLAEHPNLRYDIVPNHLFVFMDSGSSWQEDTFNGKPCTSGERSLQFDLNRRCFVNKFQLIFPRSQEDYQPVKVAASAQHKFSANTIDSSDAQEAMWFGNYQHTAPFGKQTPDNQVTFDYEYLNTHTQRGNTLHDGSTYLLKVKDYSAPSQNAFSGTNSGPVYATALRGGRSSVVTPNTGSATYVEDQANVINPGFDSYRQEYGPFARGCTIDELYDSSVVKAVVARGGSASWETVEQPNRRFFYSPELFVLTDVAVGLSKHSICVLSNGVYSKLTNNAGGHSALLNTSVTKYVFPSNVSSSDYSPLFLVTHFTNLSVYVFDTFSVYLVSGETVRDSVLTEYVVKESYYFSPWYDQYTLTSSSSGGTLRPPATELGQKMVQSDFATAQYFGVTFGSYLSDSSTHRYTRGLGNKMRMYSLRLCTQLFSFTASGGFVSGKGSETPTTTATFRKRYQGGILTECAVANPGAKYTNAEYDSTSTHVYPEIDGNYDDVFIDPSSGIPLDRTDTRVEGNLDALNQSASKLGLDAFASSQPCKLKAEMEDDKTLNEYQFYLKAASKTPLRRFFEIQLDLSS